MGLMDILKDIDLKDIAMGMAVASHGNTAVPNVINIMEQRRKEEEARERSANTTIFITSLFKNLSGPDPTMDLMKQQRTVNAMPDEVTQYDTSGIPAAVSQEDLMASMVDPTVGIVRESPEDQTPAWDTGSITGKRVSNPEKAKASADFILSVYKARETIPNVADAVASLMPQIQGKDLDPQLVMSALSTVYNKRESQIAKMMDIAARHEEKEADRKAKSMEIVSFDPTHRVMTKGGKLISEGSSKKTGAIYNDLSAIYGSEAVDAMSPAERITAWKNIKSDKVTVIGHDPKGNPITTDEVGQQWVTFSDGTKEVYRGKITPKVDRVEKTEKDRQPTTLTELKGMMERGEITRDQYKKRLLAVPGLFNYLSEEGGGGEPTSGERPQAKPKGEAPKPTTAQPQTNSIKANAIGNNVIIEGKSYPIVNGIVTVGKQKYRVK